MHEESERLTNKIQATMASLECHYHEEAAWEYNIQEALDALQTLMVRAKQKEEDELSRRYEQLHQAPLAALWENLPEGTVLPPSAVRNESRTNNPQGFHETGRNTTTPHHPSWRGQGRGRTRPGHGRGVQRGISMRGRRPANRQTVQAMMTLLSGMMDQYQ